jgi:adenylosuccinate synthase
MIQEKELIETDELNKSHTRVKINKKTEIILKEKIEREKLQKNEEETFDLWPVMTKKLF